MNFFDFQKSVHLMQSQILPAKLIVANKIEEVQPPFLRSEAKLKFRIGIDGIECKEPFVTQLEDDYNDAFIQMSEFFKSTNTALGKINDRLDKLENRLEILQSDNMKIKA
ncbi:unnamed protein product, partial [Allacma fusca]